MIKFLRSALEHGCARTAKLYVLLMLHEAGAVSFKTLLAEMKFTPAAFTGLVDALVAEKLVTVGGVNGDRRAKTLTLTAQGADLVVKIITPNGQV